MNMYLAGGLQQNKDWISAEIVRKIQITKYKMSAVNSSHTRAAKVMTRKEHTSANGDVRKNG